MFEHAGKLFLRSRESDGTAWLELVDEMAIWGWKQTNKVASTMSPQIATAILLVINPLRPLKETGCLLRFLDGLQELFLAVPWWTPFMQAPVPVFT